MDYKLSDVLELTGFSKQLLYGWERRHQLMEPRRAADGSRAYSEDDVHRLQLFRTCIDHGYRIGELVSLEMGELKIVSQQCAPPAKVPLDALLSAIQSVDAKSVETKLSIHFATLGPVRFAEAIVVPLMERVGMLWREGELSIAAEHCVTAIVRTLLGQGLRLTEPDNSKALALFASPENEDHELGALTAAILAQSCGVRSLFLGAGLPVDALVQTCSSLGATAVGMSSNVRPKVELKEVLRELQDALPPSIEIWLGGQAFKGVEAGPDNRIRYFDNIQDYIAAVHRHRTVSSRYLIGASRLQRKPY